MKLSISIAIPLVLLGVVFVGGYLFMPALDSPQTKLDKLVQDKVELAQRMLNDYNAAAPRIEQAFQISTRPADFNPRWREFTEISDKHPLAATKVGPRLNAEGTALRKVSKEIADLDGTEPVSPALPGAGETFKRLQDAAKSNGKMLDEALRAVREALAFSEGEGESEARGTNHPIATRLEAVLLYHKADLMRREAALLRVRADENRQAFARLLEQANRIDGEIKAKNTLLAGGSVPGMAALPAVVLPAVTLPGFKQPTAAGKTRASKAPGTEKWWFLDSLAERLPGKKATQPAEEAASAPAPQPEEKAAAPVPSAPAANQPENVAVPPETVPSMADRIAFLQARQTRTNGNIAAAKAEIERLTQQQQDLKTRIAAAEQQAKDAELKMIDAEHTGVKGSDPKAAEAFKQKYSELSKAQRQALQELITLKEGSIRNAKSSADEPEQILRAPLVAVDPSKPMQPERGLKAVESDLAGVQQLLAKGQALLAEIDRQITELTEQRGTLQARMAKLQDERKKVLAEASKLSTEAIKAVAKADGLEKEAIALITGPGEKAASQAKNAANTYQRHVQTFVRSENPADLPEKKLTDMAADQYTAAGAASVKGDLELLAARTQLQQASDLKLHEQMLRSMAAAGMPTKPDAKQLPEGMAAAAVPAAATSADEAGKVAQADLVEAAKLAKQALESYEEAAKQLKDLWAVHANIAAVHLLMAQLPRAQNDTEDHLAQARQIFGRAIQGREKRPEYPTYRWILDGLKTAQAGPAKP